ncbi:MAG TPA: LacI family DNA-binding transcriptional regulator [Sphingomonas sp.]|nr:LacI family DNA-binding transcriptional regulator [Sphingomonas sp.]
MARARPDRRATITDVADAAGVSIKTVSRVFNDEPNVRPQTRERVLQAAAELDYHPNVAARSLAGRKSFLIGMAYENPSPNYVVDLQNGAVERTRGTRWRLLFLPCPDAGAVSGRMQAIARTSGLDGLILAPPLSDDPATIEDLEQSGIPYVRIGPTRDGGAAPDIRVDDAAATMAIIDHLVGLGHGRIAIVHGDPTHGSAAERADGFARGMAAHGLQADPALEGQGYYTFASGLEAGRRLLALPEGRRPTAIFACNDDMAAGVLSAAHEARIVVPDALSIAGYDDSNIASVVWPRLTTIRQPIFEMARAAADELLALIEGEEPAPHSIFPYQLIVRGSTGPAPR